MAAKPPAALLSAAFVYVRKGGTIPPLLPLYSGQYRVLASGPKVFRLQVGEREKTVSIHRLKPHRGAAPVQPALPPARGRPRAGLVLARGPVAAQMYEFSYTENPPNCVGGIWELFIA